MDSGPLLVGADTVSVSVEVAYSSAKFEVSPQVSDKVVSGAREFIDSVPLMVGAYTMVMVAAEECPSTLTRSRYVM